MMLWHVRTLVVLALTWQVGCEGNDSEAYANHTLIRIIPHNENQFNATRSFNDSETLIMKVSYGYNDSLDLLVPPSRLDFVHDYAKTNNLDLEVKQSNYGRSFKEHQRIPKRRVLNGFNLYNYNSNAAIQEYIKSLALRRPDLMKVELVGKSYQGKDMNLVKISSAPNAGNPVIFIDAGVHAREWVAPAMAMYIIHQLTSTSENLKELDGIDWYILPLVNPDGYEFTRASRANRLWRKTRSRSPDGNCYGVDGNRNYGFHWGVSGVSRNPCDRETYAGPRPFSEVETQVVRDVMHKYAKRIKLYVSLHSYGNYLVYPWGYTGNFLPEEWKKLDYLARKVSDSIERAGGQPMKVLSAGKWYAAAGGSDDYAFGAVGIPYSYTMELTEGYEFEFPSSLLRTALRQFYNGFKTFAAEIKGEFGRVR